MTAEQLAALRTPPLEIGPNGHPVEYTENGDKVEWIPSQECFCDETCPGEECAQQEWANILRRGDGILAAEHKELWDKVWWTRRQLYWQRINSGQMPIPIGQSKASHDKGLIAALRIEKKHGRENLMMLLEDNFQLGLLNGRLSALAWVFGTDWEESLDT